MAGQQGHKCCLSNLFRFTHSQQIPLRIPCQITGVSTASASSSNWLGLHIGNLEGLVVKQLHSWHRRMDGNLGQTSGTTAAHHLARRSASRKWCPLACQLLRCSMASTPEPGTSWEDVQQPQPTNIAPQPGVVLCKHCQASKRVMGISSWASQPAV